MRALMWFRSDLRVSDNPALHAAAARADRGVVGAFVICPTQWRTHDDAPIKVDFILRNLHQLSESLRAKNIALKVVETADFAGVARALRGIAREFDCDALFFNREYGFNERTRDETVMESFENAGAHVCAFTDQCIFEPGDLRTGEGTFYRVYTPFRHAWRDALAADPDRASPCSAPQKLAEMIGEPDRVPQQVEGFAHDRSTNAAWPAGETAARGKLGAFIRHHLDSYKEDRDIPAASATSGLSAYLNSGVISLRQCLHAAIDTNNGHVAKGSPGAVQWINELVWREFYKHILVGFPRVSMHRAFQSDTEQIEWHKNDAHFEAWCRGHTGFPVVDAGMRQLAETGWMHNRLRMIVAMFFSKNLFLDWRRGERFFMQHLIDGDLAANNGGWQWSASTGTDAAPYFRIFNPVSQSKKCDPDGAFIRRYVPELAKLDSTTIHEPWTLSMDDRRAIGYPEPIVDLQKTRSHAINAFKSLRA